MVKRIGSLKRKSRHKLTKEGRNKGKISLSSYFKKLEIGSKVALKMEPAVQRGVFAPRFFGKIGTVKAKRGSCYQIAIKDGNKQKVIDVHPVHLKAISENQKWLNQKY